MISRFAFSKQLTIAWTVAILIALSATSVLAQASQDNADPNAVIQQLQKKIDDLEASQKQMQDQLEKISTPTAAEESKAPAEIPAAAAPQTDAPEGTSLGPVKLRGFGNFDFGRAWLEKRPPEGIHGSSHSLTIGDFDLFTNTRISDHWSVLGEMLVTSDFSNEFGAELDRFMLTYRKDDHFKISFGRYGTSLGYYTHEFNRAQYFQTSAGRPIMYSDEDNGGILPTHSIGASATGLVPSGTLGLHWIAELSNGRSSLTPDVPVQNFVDENNGKAFNVGFYVRPEKIEGLQVGFSMYRDNLHPIDHPTVSEAIYTGHVAFVGQKLEWLNEAALVRHEIASEGEIFHNLTGYTQVSYLFGKTRPYFRYDYQNTSKEDPIFGEFGRHNAPSIGVARHISNYVVLKLQGSHFSERNAPATNLFTAQLAFTF